MKAAKENEAQTAEQYSRESIRIARTTRDFFDAQRGFGGLNIGTYRYHDGVWGLGFRVLG